MKRLFLLSVFSAILFSCTDIPEEKELPRAVLVSVSVDGRMVSYGGSLPDVSLSPEIRLSFTREVTADSKSLAFISFPGPELRASADGDDIVLTVRTPLVHSSKYTMTVPAGEMFGVDLLEGYTFSFTTAYDTSDKFPRIPTDALLDKVEEQTFEYFWDYAHPDSGLARERLGSGDTVTSGGSGFGIMCIPVGIERGFITRGEGAERMRKIVSFLGSKAERFHGAFPHWLNGSTGKTIPFSSKDNGGDLVETGFLVEGLLAAREYFDRADEADIRLAIDTIWQEVEWDWYTKDGEKVLYWHWSPDQEWAMNMQVNGWNEALIVYVLAASSPTHPIDKDTYVKGWARSGSMSKSTVAPMFFAHYSFLGLDPRNLSDVYGNYWDHNVAHATRNWEYCKANPKGHGGYSEACWGLTASDYPYGYTASSPSSDSGTIAPTAALASMPYLPDQSIAAMETFYYTYGNKLWGEYGFRDAFNLDSMWFADSYIAIDQGPIVIMIENYRSALLWKTFMKNTDVRAGLDKLGFTYE